MPCPLPDMQTCFVCCNPCRIFHIRDAAEWLQLLCHAHHSTLISQSALPHNGTMSTHNHALSLAWPCPGSCSMYWRMHKCQLCLQPLSMLIRWRHWRLQLSVPRKACSCRLIVGQRMIGTIWIRYWAHVMTAEAPSSCIQVARPAAPKVCMAIHIWHPPLCPTSC